MLVVVDIVLVGVVMVVVVLVTAVSSSNCHCFHCRMVLRTYLTQNPYIIS